MFLEFSVEVQSFFMCPELQPLNSFRFLLSFSCSGKLLLKNISYCFKC